MIVTIAAGSSDTSCTVTCFRQGATTATVTVSGSGGTYNDSDTFYCQGNP